MKTKTVARFGRILPAGLLAAVLPVSAQTFPGGLGTAVPVVTIRATDPSATWAGDPGVFTIFREGETNLTLNVFYRIFGTASNGVDYVAIGDFWDEDGEVYRGQRLRNTLRILDDIHE